jgi:hypothetical protein
LSVRVWEVCADIVIVYINLSRIAGKHSCWTAWVVLTPKIDVSVSINWLKTDISQGVVGERSKQIIMPLLWKCVYEDRIIREAVVEVNDKGKVGRRFSATAGGRD